MIVDLVYKKLRLRVGKFVYQYLITFNTIKQQIILNIIFITYMHIHVIQKKIVLILGDI